MSLLAPHRLVLLALVVALLGAAVVGEEPARESGPRPAADPLPALPWPANPDPAVAPRPRPLERDEATTDRFTAEGQSVLYPFQAEAGELSLFELSAAGYARGWSMGSRLRVLAPDGRVLAESAREGGVQIEDLLPFVAPEPGLYRLELGAATHHFRYAIVRHSDYPARQLRAVEVGTRERVHGWVAAGDRARYRVPVRAGETLALSVEGTREAARSEHHRLLAEAGATEAMMSGMRAMRGGEMEEPAPRLFPELALEVVSRPAPACASDTFALLAPAAEDGVVELSVSLASEEAATLFDLAVRRDVPTVEVGGLVVGAGDEPLEGLEVLLLLEPDQEPWAAATTGADGAWSARVPEGDYRVELRRQDDPEPQLAAAAVHGPTELNLLWRE